MRTIRLPAQRYIETDNWENFGNMQYTVEEKQFVNR